MKSKKDRKIEKQYDATERKYLKKYPWFRIESFRLPKRKRIINPNRKWGEPRKVSAYFEFPDAWFRTFGEMMLKEIDKVIKEDNLKHFRVEQIKSKYAELRFYYCGGNERITEIVNKYERLSQNICEICGKPDSGIVGRYWITCECEDCYKKNKYDVNISYQEAIIDEDTKMANSYTIKSYSLDKGEESTTYDISETANLIRQRWNRRHPHRTVGGEY